MPNDPKRPFAVVLAAILGAVLIAAGCVASPPGSNRPVGPGDTAPSDGGDSAGPSLDLAGLDDATATAVRIRTSYGLRSDLDFIGRVALDPTATTEFGTPLLPRETQELWDRSTRADAVIPVVQDYAAANRAVFGGVWIDQSLGGVVTVSFTDDLRRHQTALAELLKGRGVVHVVQARYPESVMRALQDRIAADDAWFRSIPAALRGVGYDAIRNVVMVEVSTANPRIANLILARFGSPADTIDVQSDGTGIVLEPWGVIHVRIVAVPAKVVAELTLDYHSDRIGADCGQGDVGIGFGATGTVDLPCQGGHWAIQAGRNSEDIVARGEVDLAPGGAATVTLRPIAP